MPDRFKVGVAYTELAPHQRGGGSHRAPRLSWLVSLRLPASHTDNENDRSRTRKWARPPSLLVR